MKEKQGKFKQQCINYIVKNNLSNYSLYDEAIELFISDGKKYVYFCTVGVYDKKTFEVFKTGVGAEVDNNGVYTNNGELWQYRTFSRLGDALNFAVRHRNRGSLPCKPQTVW